MKKGYLEGLRTVLLRVEATNRGGQPISVDKAIEKTIDLIIRRNKKGSKIVFIGNGGSASIASHMATDFLKNAGMPALAFNDASLITCLSNDLGYGYVFQKPIELLVQRGDVLFAISSSGKSKNILNAAKEARRKGCFLVTLSGFNEKNPLRKLGDINFYIPFNSYGYVEISHLSICHCIADNIIEDYG